MTESGDPKYRKFAKRFAQRNVLSFMNVSVNYINASSHNPYHTTPSAFSTVACQQLALSAATDKTFTVTREFVAAVLEIAEKLKDRQPRDRLVDIVTQEIVQYSSDSRSSSDSSNHSDLTFSSSDSVVTTSSFNNQHDSSIVEKGGRRGRGESYVRLMPKKRKREMSGCSLSDFIRAYLNKEERQNIRTLQDNVSDCEFFPSRSVFCLGYLLKITLRNRCHSSLSFQTRFETSSLSRACFRVTCDNDVGCFFAIFFQTTSQCSPFTVCTLQPFLLEFSLKLMFSPKLF